MRNKAVMAVIAAGLLGLTLWFLRPSPATACQPLSTLLADSGYKVPPIQQQALQQDGAQCVERIQFAGDNCVVWSRMVTAPTGMQFQSLLVFRANKLLRVLEIHGLDTERYLPFVRELMDETLLVGCYEFGAYDPVNDISDPSHYRIYAVHNDGMTLAFDEEFSRVITNKESAQLVRYALINLLDGTPAIAEIHEKWCPASDPARMYSATELLVASWNPSTAKFLPLTKDE